MSQYIILVDMRDNNLGIGIVKKNNGDIRIFNDIADAKNKCGVDGYSKTFPCEIVDLDDLGWCD